MSISNHKLKEAAVTAITPPVPIRRRVHRSRELPYYKKLPPCLVGTEACATAHPLGRQLMASVLNRESGRVGVAKPVLRGLVRCKGVSNGAYFRRARTRKPMIVSSPSALHASNLCKPSTRTKRFPSRRTDMEVS